MEIIRLSTWINAPAERCFRLATSREFHLVLVKGKTRASAGALITLALGDRLLWPGHYLGLRLHYATRIDQMRPFNFFREVLDGGYFRHLEHEHYFTALNDGTRVRDELRFVAPVGMLRPLVRRYLMSQLRMRGQILKETAQSDAWRSYLEPLERPNNSAHPETRQPRNDAPQRVATSHMATHRS